MIAPRAFVTDEEAHRATADAVMLARSIRFLLNFVVVGYVVKATFYGILRCGEIGARLPPPSHSRFASLGTLALKAPCFGRFHFIKNNT